MGTGVYNPSRGLYPHSNLLQPLIPLMFIGTTFHVRRYDRGLMERLDRISVAASFSDRGSQ